LKNITSILAHGLLAGFIFSQPNRMLAAETSRPNVIIILADDLGYGDIGCYGALPEHVRTPTMDRLANEGLRFTDAHAPSSVCTPSRYSLLTGEYGFRNRLADGIIAGDAPLSITPRSFTLPALFQKNGYATAFVGKWHLGLAHGGDTIDWNGDIKPGPVEIGFDHAFYMPSTGDRVPTVLIRDHRVENLDPADPIRVSYVKKIGDEPTGKEDPEAATVLLGASNEGHQGTITKGVSRIGWMTGGQAARWTDAELMNRLNAEAIRFIQDNRSKSFFLYFATHDIHEPRVPATNYVGQSGCGVYGDQIMELDHAVDLVLKTLDDLKIADNTLVILSSDNGGSLTDMKAYQYGVRANLHGHRINGVLRGGKYSAWEGGTRVPMIVRWPGRVPAGGVSPALVSLTDLEASLARLIGVKLPEKAAPDSADVLGALLGKSPVGRNELVEHKAGKAGALREGNWKYIDGKLYDLSHDLSETNNLAKEQPERTKSMAARLKELGAADTLPSRAKTEIP
jgi:arylsulfatase A-like enzyme